MLGAQQHLDAGYVAAIKAHNPQATKAKRAARRATARATANTFLRALALRVLSPQQTHGCSPKELLDRGFAIQLAGGAKKCAGLAYQVILGRAHRVRRWGGQGGANYDDFRRAVEKLKTDFNITEEQAVARLQAVEGKLRHPYLVGLDRQRANIVAYNESGQKKENRADSGNAGNHAAVQTRVRKSSASLVEFELDSIFSPLKDTDKDSLTYIMPETQVQKARKAAREAHALEKSSETLNDFKLRTWTVSCLLSDLWYVNRDSIAKRTLRAGGRVQDGT
jgi:hypothetical protein